MRRSSQLSYESVRTLRQVRSEAVAESRVRGRLVAEQVGEEAAHDQALGLAAGKTGFVGITAPGLRKHPDILKRTRRGRTIQGRAYDHGGLLLCAKL